MIYEIDETETYAKWFDRLKDRKARTYIRHRVNRVREGNFGDWKPEGGEVRAMRIDYGPGYRLYYTICGNKILLLLCGGDKHTQRADIKKAQKLLKGEVIYNESKSVKMGYSRNIYG
jgi:putative addiction module killer protein